MAFENIEEPTDFRAHFFFFFMAKKVASNVQALI